MATDFHPSPEQSTTSLVGGIIDDVQDLVKQQIELTRQELKEEMRKASDAVECYVAGGGILFLGLFFVGLALVHLLHWMSSPAGADVGRIPLWGCCALVGGAVSLMGAVIAWTGRTKLASIHPLHNRATEALKDNVNWVTAKK
jgi:hypothetical protein